MKTKCEYCTKNYEPLTDEQDTYIDNYTGGPHDLYMGINLENKNKLTAFCDFESGGYYVTKTINYCPMCGRKLNDEK